MNEHVAASFLSLVRPVQLVFNRGVKLALNDLNNLGAFGPPD